MTTTAQGLRPAATEDLRYIKEWLVREAEGNSGFIHNWSMIHEAQNEDHMLVFEATEGVVGFLTYGISRSSILQIKSDHVRRGIGRALVERAIANEVAGGNPIQVVQCEPKSSAGFWRRMGFRYYRQRNNGPHEKNVYMYHVSELQHPNTDTTGGLPVTILVYPSAALNRRGEVIPDQVHYAMGEYNSHNDTLLLDHRICVVDEDVLEDAVVEVRALGSTWFFEKAKRNSAFELGFKECKNHSGWYIDAIRRPTSPVEL
ncbi:GNAT family N-acetyltransferase [Stenotrophomonas maltophilia]|nr:GNAT family N-acetyltransferase [Stenotrophomonas maltophilia]MBH1599178.1 GNAT family N-acetyltransferase [Stenotrophomonas maltophilia]